MHLILFFTYGVSLKTWDKTGLIDREILLYKQLVEKGVKVLFVTYGDSSDYQYQEKLGEIEIVPFYAYTKRPNLRVIRFLHSFLLPFFLLRKLRQADILKTNQVMGGWVPILSKLIYRKKLIIRCGYEWYRLTLHRNESFLYKIFVWINSWMAYKFSDKIIITSNENKNFMTQTFFISPEKVDVLINYIATDKFRKKSCHKHRNKLLFIGRLSKEKNIFQLLDAVLQTGYELDIIGDGDQKREIEAYIKSHGIKANLLGRFPNAQMPEIINRYSVYILPSIYEGNPKTLLEAMACGSAVIGTKVAGIREIIENNKNGMLCEIDSGSIKETINLLMQDADLRGRLGKGARKFIMENCRLEAIVEREYNLYKELLSKNA
jgi:glycosyltransferase involved in cell wall biosynthesis